MRYPEEVIVRGIGRWAKEAWEKEWVNKEMWTDHKELAASLISEIWPQKVYRGRIWAGDLWPTIPKGRGWEQWDLPGD
jgi:hypothetical protein